MTNASDDLVERLRDRDAIVMSGLFHCVPTMQEATDEITSLRSQLAAAEAANGWLVACDEQAKRMEAEARLKTATKALELVIMSDCGEPKICAEIAGEALRAI